MIKVNWIFIAVLAAVVFTAAIPCAAAPEQNAQCLMCHSASSLSGKNHEGKTVSFHVDSKEIEGSIHGQRLCVDCHSDLKGKSLPHSPKLNPVNCASCHEDSGYHDSVHGRAVTAGDKEAPSCKDCHGTHNIQRTSDEKSSVYRTNIPATCSKCHNDGELMERHNVKPKQAVKYYINSVHGRAVSKKGNLGAAVCTDCHSAHDIRSSKDPAASINKPNIPSTCGKCHSDIYNQYQRSIHGNASANGVKDAPVCTDCHGEHSIQAPSNRQSTVNPIHVVATCSKCHENARINKRYKLPVNRLSSYIGSYHGVANKFGETTVANCASCHGAHDILPSSDIRSSVNHKNLPHTCGKCHPGAGTNFAAGTIHLTPSKHKDALIFWVKLAYGLFVAGMISSFGLYIVMDIFSRKRRNGHSNPDQRSNNQ